MARLFGTDGIRGVANVDLKPTLAYALGRATAHRLVGPGRRSSSARTPAAPATCSSRRSRPGPTSLGADVHQVGVVPTPALAFLAGSGRFAAGIMVSASHNPADDNGLKVLDGDGLKLDDSVEDELEQLIWRADDLGGATNAGLGRIVVDPDLVDDYLRHRLALAGSVQATGTHLVLDGANGSGAALGAEILRATGATVEVIHAEPDGDQHQPPLRGDRSRIAGRGGRRAGRRRRVRARRRRRPADRGRRDRPGRRRRPGPGHPRARPARSRAPCRAAVVVSVLSNGGLQSVVEAAGGQVVRTPVGDKYILEGMQVSGARLGGEKSGHVIVLDHTTIGRRHRHRPRGPAGDGRERTGAWPTLAADIPMLPQQQRAVKVRHKDQWEADRILQGGDRRGVGAGLAPAGRVLVRPSGTEPALRVMVEGPDADLVTELADSLASARGRATKLASVPTHRSTDADPPDGRRRTEDLTACAASSATPVRGRRARS